MPAMPGSLHPPDGHAEGLGEAAKVGVVIRTLDESRLIGTCLDTLQGQRGAFDLDVVVVDSGSTDSTVEIARSRGARVVEMPPDEFDYSKALNLGIQHARGDVVLILSAHAVPVNDEWVATMTAPFADPSVAGVASRQVPWPNAPWREVARLGRAFDSTRRIYSQANAGEVVFSNAASAIRRAVWLDQPFTLPAVEDLDWARRVLAAGWTLVYQPGAVVFHSHDESPRAQARRLIDIARAHDAGSPPRTPRRTARDAAGLVYRDARSIVSLDESLRRKLGHIRDLLLIASYYVTDFSRDGTTAERRRVEPLDPPDDATGDRRRATRSIFGPLRSWAANSETVRNWRQKRYRMFEQLCDLDPGDTILDVGAGRGAALERFNTENHIVAIDLRPDTNGWLSAPNVTVLTADGTRLPFDDSEFDVGFSNSVIEHVPRSRQAAFADEMRRVSKRYFVQTPNRYFPVEPHYQLPLFQFLPERVRRMLNRHFALGWQAKGEWEEITLLSARDLRALFPDAEIHRERVLGLTKSLIAVRR